MISAPFRQVARLTRIGRVFLVLALLFPLPLMAGFNPVISEFMSSNQGGLTDEDGDRSDWIEICNVGDSAGDLGGWYLTDDSDDLTGWAFPDTPLPAGAYLVVFASGKNRRVSGSQLHADFKLSASGEYLALVQSNGTTVVSDYAPVFPAQLADVSYGLGMMVTATVFVASNAPCHVLVPTNDTLGLSWTGEGFAPDGWSNGPSGVGFDLGGTPPEGLVAHWTLDEPLGHAVIADVSGNGHGGLAKAGTTLGADGATGKTATAAAFNNGGIDVPYDTTLNPASFTVVAWARPITGGSDHRSVITSRRSSSGNCDGYIIYVEPGNTWQFWTGDGVGWRVLQGPAVALDAWTHLAITYDNTTGRKSFYINGSPYDSTTSQGYSVNPSVGLHIGSGGDTGTQYPFRGDIDDVALFNMALDETAVRTAMSNSVPESSVIDYAGLIGRDVQAAMHGRNASAYARFPFTVNETGNFASLLLRMKYDDGFLAYLNGQLIASRNAPGVPAYDSAATTLNPDAGAVLFEEINVSSYLGALHGGTNVLAIHGLNIASNNEDFLVVPELTGMTTATPVPGEVGYFAVPSPGKGNPASLSEIGPWISDIGHAPAVPDVRQPLVVTAVVARTFHDIGTVTLFYRAVYNAEATVAMAHAGDGIYTATIPGGTAGAGEMLRYRIVANDVSTNSLTAPIFADQTGVKQSPRYFGTMVRDPSASSALPIFYWWTQDYSASHSRAGARVCVFYNGEFYDNIYARERGQATNSGSQKFIFGNAHPLYVNEKLRRVRECNMNAQGVDDSYIRQTLSFELFTEAGVPACESFLVRMRVNGNADRVGVFIEQVDDEFLDRHGLDEEGTLYKFVQKRNLNPGLSEQPDGTEIKIPEDRTDFSDLQGLIDGLALTGNADRQLFVFDNLNLPEVVNYLAVRAIIQDCDDVRKNFYMHCDSLDTGEWRIFPWDKDFTYGILGDGGTYATHPFLGDYVHRKQNADQWSRLFEVFFNLPETRDMFRRRTRTLMDRCLLPPGTTAGESWLEQRAAALFAQADPHLGSSASSSYAGVQAYFPTKRTNLYVTHHEDNLPADVAGIPDAQVANPPIQFGTIHFNPASGNQDEEYVELINTNAVAVDLSRWTVSGAVRFTFAPGTVILANTNLYLCRSVRALRARAVAPKGGMGLFAVGDYDGGLSNFGESLELRGGDTGLVATVTYEGDPTPQQLDLRISEIHYNPLPAETAQSEMAVTNSEFEFVELINTGTNTLDIGGVRFTNGIVYAFPSNTTLAADARVVVVKNSAAFESRYGPGIDTFGPYGGYLDDSGETIELRDANGNRIQEFRYGDGFTTYSDGRGPSMEVVNTDADYGSASNWSDSARIGGTPGRGPDADVRDVVINEVLSHTDPPAFDAIELHNTSTGGVDVGGWLLSDSSDRYRKFTIPSNTVVSAGGYVTFDESDFNPTPLTPGTNHFALDGAHGDDVWLIATRADGRSDRIADTVLFGAAANGESLGRWPNATGTLYPMVSVTLDTANSGPRVGPVIVSEIMYHYPGDTNGTLEFVEIYNPGSGPVNLANWQIVEAASYAFPSNATLAATGIVVVVGFDPTVDTNLAAVFRATYGIDNSVVLLGPFDGRLDNSGDRVRLSDPDEPPAEEPGFYPALLEDEVTYRRTSPWPTTADGGGDSLNRRAAEFWGNAAASWRGAAPTPGTYVATNATGFALWQQTAFPPGTSPHDRAWDADPNNNGRANLLEYAFVFDPDGSGDDGLAGFRLVQATSNSVDLVYRSRTNAPDLTYAVEISPDMVAWDDTENHVTRLGAPLLLADGLSEERTVRVNTTAAFSGRRGYMRLVIVLISP